MVRRGNVQNVSLFAEYTLWGQMHAQQGQCPLGGFRRNVNIMVQWSETTQLLKITALRRNIPSKCFSNSPVVTADTA